MTDAFVSRCELIRATAKDDVLAPGQGEQQLIGAVFVNAGTLGLVKIDDLLHRLVRDALGRLASFAQGKEQRRHRPGVEDQGQHAGRTARPGFLGDVDRQTQFLLQTLHGMLGLAAGDVSGNPATALKPVTSVAALVAGCPAARAGPADVGLEQAAAARIRVRGGEVQADLQAEQLGVAPPGRFRGNDNRGWR